MLYTFAVSSVDCALWLNVGNVRIRVTRPKTIETGNKKEQLIILMGYSWSFECPCNFDHISTLSETSWRLQDVMTVSLSSFELYDNNKSITHTSVQYSLQRSILTLSRTLLQPRWNGRINELIAWQTAVKSQIDSVVVAEELQLAKPIVSWWRRIAHRTTRRPHRAPKHYHRNKIRPALAPFNLIFTPGFN